MQALGGTDALLNFGAKKPWFGSPASQPPKS
jgi:hypothetical protein